VCAAIRDQTDVLRRGAFAPDDYEEINRTYFDDIFISRSWSALPAGWHNPHSDGAGAFVPCLPELHNWQRYSVDEGYALGDQKRALLKLISAWESRAIGYDEVTLCPSVSTANLLVLCGLKANGFDTIIFETPAYFATLQQTELLQLSCIRIPCFRDEQFEASLSAFEQAICGNARCALWITQPRFGLGTNQKLDRLRALGELLGPNNPLVIDEAAEQTFPSVVAALGPIRCPVIRTRGLLKGAGLNGLRISFVLHCPHWRSRFEEILEAAGASLDRFSLSNAASIALTPGLLPSMLTQANAQVQRERKKLEIMSLGSWMEPTALENSYIGSLLLDLTSLPGSYESKRKAFLAFCRTRRMPVILSASVGFAFDDRWEAVRINYFTPADNVERAARTLLEAYAHLT
jgi:histidinol-phosphate/aromatic aminotransferase/cobyric acid decarboxylase-like protein